MIAPLSASSSTLNQPPAPQQARSDGDSDSDWDDDDDFVAKKINIKIKPIAQMTPSKVSASMDELRATVGTWKSMGNINLVKPNSRRSQCLVVQPPAPQQQQQQPPLISQLQPTLSQPQIPQISTDTYRLPVALAVQECLNVRTLLGPSGESSTSLIGHVRMAVPTKIVRMDGAQFENNDLVLNISTPTRWSDVRLNEELVRETASHESNCHHGDTNGNFYLDPMDTPVALNPSHLGSRDKQVTVDMKMVHKRSREIHQKRPNGSYVLLPELLNYKITQSHKRPPGGDYSLAANGNSHLMADGHSDACLNPIKPIAHWLCDLSVTKVRIDFESLSDELSACGLRERDVRNIKISLQVDGDVKSHQSKPPAVWSPIDSKLTWCFNDLSELIEASTHSGVTSCLAKLSLNDGPSTPDDVDVQFSIVGKTLSGTQITIERDQGNFYHISKQKLEVRTGQFRCGPPDPSLPSLI